MIYSRRGFLLGSTAVFVAAPSAALPPVFEISSPMAPPEWALLEREVLRAHTSACVAFYTRYFNKKTNYLECVARWGGDDGPDDAIENVNDWPHLYALGASETLRRLYEKAYEGHVRQYTKAHTVQTPIARHGMYYKEFPVMMDWQHTGEGLSVFNLMGLGAPYDRRYRQRVKRFAGFYMNEDRGAPNYDPKLRLIRSMFNGSRGPLLRKTTPQDWAGDPFTVENRFAASDMVHGESSYQQMLDHFREYRDTVGDSPLNLLSTGLALNAYMLDHQLKYKKWLLDYADAWLVRAKSNNDILPSNIGLDGSIGGGADGKWYGGVYGWNFSPVVPQTGKRENRNRIPRALVGFMNAYLISGGDDRYLDVWRRQADRIDAQSKEVNGVMSAPTMYGDQGWYGYRPGKYNFGFLEIYFLSMKPEDRARCEETPWYAFLEGRNADYPQQALREALDHIRMRNQALRSDHTTAKTRLADSVMEQNPASVAALTQLMEGGLYIQHPGWARTSPPAGGTLLFCRLRYFDPAKRRAGIPEDVAALIETMTADAATVTLVNLNPSEERVVTVQGGAYGEHRITSVDGGGKAQSIDAPFFSVRLAPGAGAKLKVVMQRFANRPTLDFPWNRAA